MTNKCKHKRRSMLFCPAVNTKYLKKALCNTADSIIFDLEDSVDDLAKPLARENLLRHYPIDYDGPKELIIRINNAHSPFYNEDIGVVKELQPDTVCYPKVESPNEIIGLEEFLRKYEKRDRIEIFPLIETPIGYFNAMDILRSSDRITAVALGLEDFTANLGIERGKLWEDPIINNILVTLIILSNSERIQHIGPVTRGYKTKDQLNELEEECKYLRKMNVVGKLAIHPNQLGIINKEFDITPEQIQTARDKLKLFEQAKGNGSNVISSNFRMEDTPSVLRLSRFIDYAKDHGYI